MELAAENLGIWFLLGAMKQNLHRSQEPSWWPQSSKPCAGGSLTLYTFPVGTKEPQQQHINLSHAANIASSYLLIEERMIESEISGGKRWDVVQRNWNSSLSKFSACLIAWFGWEFPWYVEIFRFLMIGLRGGQLGGCIKWGMSCFGRMGRYVARR